MKPLSIFILLISCVWACNNIEDATPADRNSFVKFYHGTHPYSAVEVEVLPDGYAILGNMKVAEDSIVTLLIRTDKKGNRLSEPIYFTGNTAKSFEVVYTGSAVSGYVILSDSIKIDPAATKVGNIQVHSTRLLKVSTTGTILQQKNYRDNTQDTSRVKTDFKGNSLIITDQEQIIVLGNYQEDLSRPEKAFLVALDEDFNQDWLKQYDLIDAGQLDYNYVNGKSMHYKQGTIIWSSSILKSSGEFNDSYLAIPYVEEQSTFKNFSQLGQASSQLFLAKDIQPSSIPGFGYGVVGTRGQTDGRNTNIFFARVDGQGNFIANSERYYDGALSKLNVSVEFNQSESLDAGESLTATADGGFVLAGSTKTGSGSTELYLIKVDASGDMEWNKIIGGSGDETISCIREEEDGSLVICGTNTLEGLSSIFLIRTDRNGELKN